jgi:hypothetical protein
MHRERQWRLRGSGGGSPTLFGEIKQKVQKALTAPCANASGYFPSGFFPSGTFILKSPQIQDLENLKTSVLAEIHYGGAVWFFRRFQV